MTISYSKIENPSLRIRLIFSFTSISLEEALFDLDRRGINVPRLQHKT